MRALYSQYTTSQLIGIALFSMERGRHARQVHQPLMIIMYMISPPTGSQLVQLRSPFPLSTLLLPTDSRRACKGLKDWRPRDDALVPRRNKTGSLAPKNAISHVLMLKVSVVTLFGVLVALVLRFEVCSASGLQLYAWNLKACLKARSEALPGDLS